MLVPNTSPTHTLTDVVVLRNRFEKIHGWTFVRSRRNDRGEQLYTLWSELDRTELVIADVTYWVLELEFDLINDDISQETYDMLVEKVALYGPCVL